MSSRGLSRLGIDALRDSDTASPEPCWKPGALLRDLAQILWSPAEVLLESCWSPAGVLLESCWSLAGVLLESCWSLAGVLLESCWSLAGILLVFWSCWSFLEPAWKEGATRAIGGDDVGQSGSSSEFMSTGY